jgi:hypothetical protein
VPLEGVVNALHRIHKALRPDGLVVDTQPVSARPRVDAGGAVLGTLDMSAWRGTIDAIDRLVSEVIDEGLYVLEAERHFIVTDTYNSGAELIESVSGWQGTRISRGLARRVATAPPPLAVHQQVRLRLLASRPARQ